MSCQYQLKSILSNVSFKDWVSLLIISLEDMFIGVTINNNKEVYPPFSGGTKGPHYCVTVSFYFMAVSICHIYWDAPMLGTSV